MNDLSDQAVHFGPYRIHPRQRLVLEAGRPLRLGRRAVDILLILLEHAGNVVSKQELIARVWPKSVVEDGNLRVHMAALRKALGDGQAGQRYIVTVAQRGYSFVAPLSIEPMTLPTDGAPQRPSHNLPLRRTRMIGRQALIDALVQQLPQQRFITLTGAGGIGKTTVALRVAELLIGHYRDGIHLLDLAPLSAASMILPNLAALLGLTPGENASLASLARNLQARQMLLVIDNCEHLLDDIALISETLLRHAPHLHILTTSREALRAEGEHVQRLEPLACPPATGNRAQALGYPAMQLLIERAMSHQESFALSDAELPLAIDICQRLDGIPLAIELVAAQIERFGLPGLLVQMEDNFRLLTRGRRSALPRQQTLRATLDWSFDLLTACEQICLRRLAVFRGG
ncbi:winged helix-turn-helix domain-containing protein, partial [Pseudomonas sp. Env-66]